MSTIPLERQTYNVTEAAHLLGISIRTARGEIQRSGALAGVMIIRAAPRRILIPKEAFDRVLAGQMPSDCGAINAS